MSRDAGRDAGRDVVARLEALEDAWEAAAPWLATGTADDVPDVVARVRERLGVAPDRTVVALAGSTGSGKSSLLNALADAEVAVPGILRPTTAEAVAACADGSDPTALLDLLGVRRRTALPAGGELPAGVVLLDLPDHDSVETSHRVRADRLLARADVMVWVTDPQKYADAALHEGYLRPLAAYAGVAVVALNHADRLAPDERDAVLADLRRRVADDGLDGARVVAVSARTGLGVPELRTLLGRVADRRAAELGRLATDVRVAAGHLLDTSGSGSEGRGGPPGRDGSRGRGTARDAGRADAGRAGAGVREDALVTALAEAAGVTVVTEAVAATTRRQVRLAAGWPVTRWLARLRADPLTTLGLGGPEAPRTERPDLVRASVPRPTDAVRARAATAVREHVAGLLDDLPEPWRPPAADRVDAEALADALGTAVSGVRLDAEGPPRWARALGVVQGLLLAAVVGGLLWTGTVRGLAQLGVTTTPPELVLGGGEVRLAWPALLVVGGVVCGLLVALAAHLAGRVSAARRARRARRRLEDAVAKVARGHVLAPVVARLDALARTRAAAARALR